MPREEMTSFGVPVDSGIVDYIERIDSLPKINTTYSCSGMEKDHRERSGRPYLVIATGRYVGTDLEPARRYPHDKHRTTLKVFRAAINARWYADYTTTNLNGISGISAVYLSTKPSKNRYMKILAGNVTCEPVKTRELSRKAKRRIMKEKKENFATGLSDEEIEEKWKDLCRELEWEMEKRRDLDP